MKPLKKELKAYRESGIAISLGQVPGDSKTIAEACVDAVGCGSMRDDTKDEKKNCKSKS